VPGEQADGDLRRAPQLQVPEMRIWRKNPESQANGRGVARAALDGASREELLHEALNTLSRHAPESRIGVWLEPAPLRSTQTQMGDEFCGAVWERGSHDTPREWAHLSVEPPLPQALLRGKTAEQDLAALAASPIISLFVGLRHAFWAPIDRKQCLKGIILVGSFGESHAILREQVESLAAELALAIGSEEEQETVRMCESDLGLVKRFCKRNSAANLADTLLFSLVGSCTEAAEGTGLGAVFAAIGTLREQAEASNDHFSIGFSWHSGDKSWARTIATEPVASVWRQALETRRVVGGDSAIDGMQSQVVRVVAHPLELEGKLLGVLVVGLPTSAASLVILDRLELRASLAASVLLRRWQAEEVSNLIRRQSALLDCIREPILLLDEAGRITATSRGARELICPVTNDDKMKENESPSSASLLDLFGGRGLTLFDTWLRAGLSHKSGTRHTLHEPFRTELQNGSAVRLSLVAAVEGRPTALLIEPMASRDLTSQPGNAEIELRNVIEWLEEGVVLFDAQENIRVMNTRFEQIAGFAPEESGKIRTLDGLIERLRTQAAEPLLFGERWRELARGIEGGVREELQMAHPVPRVLERAARPVLDPIGRLLGRVEIYRDLTAQRVFQSKLLQTEKLAALGQMVSGVAHELSNPLTSIMGYAHRLLARQDLPGRTEEVRQIYQEAERAGSILRQLLLNARETLPERRPVSLNQIVQRAMELLRFSLAAEKIRVEIDLEPALPFVQGDPGHLQQVLMNLVGNARQAIEQDGLGGTIQLRTKRIGERRVMLEVADNGPGIPQGILARIFDPFFTTKPPGVGTGLGLAIVLSVVREHGGQVHVLSPPQGGATFQVELPAAAETMQERAVGSSLPVRANFFLEPAKPVSREERFTTSSESAQGARVLVVEDEPTVARLIADVLEDEGMHVDVLLDGREALDRAGRKAFDLVICDMKMPGLDGQSFYRSLERSNNPLRKRFLFVTGDIVAAQTREFLERNHLPHVAKPFRVEELTEKVHSVLAAGSRRPIPPAEAVRKNVARNG
jgi:signal transduction histidine kinase/FixJ family two-component response regulator